MNKEFMLLVEGKNDEHAITQLMLKHNFNNIFHSTFNKQGNLFIEEQGGIDGIKKLLNPLELKTIIKANKNLKKLGIILDADLDLKNRWVQIRDRLIESEYLDIPPTIPKNGFISKANKNNAVIVGVWIMPNNEEAGKIEDFLKYLIPNKQQNQLYKKACQTICEIMPLNHLTAQEKRFKDIDESKALIHTWLAWQDPPAKPFGTSINANIFTSNAQEAQDLIAWLKQLFIE